MNPQDLAFVIIAIVFMIVTTTFAIRYCKLLKLAQNEYEKAKGIVGGIVLTFRKRLDRQEETIDQLSFQIETTHSAIENVTSRFQGTEGKLRDLTKIVESIPVAQREVNNHMDVLKKEVEVISGNQQTLQKQFNSLEERMQFIGKEEKRVAALDEGQPFSKLTETERIVLQFLIDEGAKTAPEVEEKIGKTREHTARLMKKLWQEGYIERDTHQLPYIYRVTENLKKVEMKI